MSSVRRHARTPALHPRAWPMSSRASASAASRFQSTAIMEIHRERDNAQNTVSDDDAPSSGDSESVFSSCVTLSQLEQLQTASPPEPQATPATASKPKLAPQDDEDEFGDFIDSETSPISIMPFQPKEAAKTQRPGIAAHAALQNLEAEPSTDATLDRGLFADARHEGFLSALFADLSAIEFSLENVHALLVKHIREHQTALRAKQEEAAVASEAPAVAPLSEPGSMAKDEQFLRSEFVKRMLSLLEIHSQGMDHYSTLLLEERIRLYIYSHSLDQITELLDRFSIAVEAPSASPYDVEEFYVQFLLALLLEGHKGLQ